MLSFLINRASMAVGRLAGPPAALPLPPALERLYQAKNGFRALDNALLVLPAERTFTIPGLAGWNAADGWRRWFDLDERLTFFAMDAVLRQFAVDAHGAVLRFDPQTEALEDFAADLDAWAERLIAGAAAQHLAREWQLMHRPLLLEERLAPSALGGALAPLHLADGMELLGERAAEHQESSREVALFDVAW